MQRQILRASCALSVLATSFVFVQGQTLSACRPAPDLRANTKPGVGGLTFSRDGKTLVVAGGDGKIRFLDAATGEVQRIDGSATPMRGKSLTCRRRPSFPRGL